VEDFGAVGAAGGGGAVGVQGDGPALLMDRRIHCPTAVNAQTDGDQAGQRVDPPSWVSADQATLPAVATRTGQILTAGTGFDCARPRATAPDASQIIADVSKSH
jgi:hypothetical protein